LSREPLTRNGSYVDPIRAPVWFSLPITAMANERHHDRSSTVPGLIPRQITQYPLISAKLPCYRLVTSQVFLKISQYRYASRAANWSPHHEAKGYPFSPELRGLTDYNQRPSLVKAQPRRAPNSRRTSDPPKLSQLPTAPYRAIKSRSGFSLSPPNRGSQII